MIICNVVVPQFSGSRRIRNHLLVVWIMSILVNVGMWFERFVIIVISLAPRFPAVELGLLPADLGGRLHFPRHLRPVLHLFLLFMRFLPMIAISEVKGSRRRPTRIIPHGGAKEGGQLMNPSPAATYGLVAEFSTPADVLHAAESVRDAGSRWDVFTPFPVHGMDRPWACATRRWAGSRLWVA
jgi:hypothetical protein